jgi:Kef-type K+ transport system membrane component KefB
VLVPVFFLHIGMKADLHVASSAGTLGLAAAVLVAAMVSKLAAGYAAGKSAGDRTTIGLAMSPRGEVGLIFASTAVTAGAFGDRLYAVVVIVVLGTTVLTPALLRRRLLP